MVNNPEYPAGAVPQGVPPPSGYPAQAVTQYPPPNVGAPQEGMVQMNPEKLQGGATGPSNAYPPPGNEYPPNAYPPPPNAYPPPAAAPGAYPPGAYPPGQPADGIPVGYPAGAGAPAGYPGAPAGYPGAAPGVMYTTAPPPMDNDQKTGSIVCVAVTLLIIGIFFPLCWLVVAFLPLCARGQNLKTQLLLRRLAMGAAVAMITYTIIAIILASLGATRWRYNSNQTRICVDQYGRRYYC